MPSASLQKKAVGSNAACYRPENKRMQNSQPLCAGNQSENSRELEEVFPTLIMREDIRLTGLEPLTQN